jgi:DNA-binding PadR family transcriptional regulator
MHKALLLLGLLLRGPLYGYELHRIVRAHGELYADLKKGNLYYLLERLAEEGFLEMKAETGARGARGERLIYELTERGRARFVELLHEVMQSYEPVHMGVDTAVVFLSYLSPAEGLRLFIERRQNVAARREAVVADLGDQAKNGALVRIASDHLLSLVDAELAWIDRSLAYLQEIGWANQADRPEQQHIGKEGEQGSE